MPPRYRLRERAELASNKGTGKGGGGLDHAEHLRGRAGRVPGEESHVCHPWMRRVVLWVLLGPLARKKVGFLPKRRSRLESIWGKRVRADRQ